MKFSVLLTIALLWATGARCQNMPDGVVPSAPTIECLMRASQGFGIPVAVILAVAKTEGGRVGMQSPNTNGSYDLGPMQINDRVWVPVLAQLTGGNYALARNILINHGCANLIFGTWILKQEYDKSGNLATAVGWYHSRTPVHMNRYQEKVKQNLLALLGGMQRGTN